MNYYNAIRFVVIDPMHNLLLGTARHVFQLWTELGILTTKSLDELQTRVENIKVPNEVGRIPLRISSGFAGFTADQWKNWTTIYSLFCLKGLISRQRYEMCFESYPSRDWKKQIDTYRHSNKICRTVWSTALHP